MARLLTVVKFGLVGACAALVHYLMTILFVEGLHLAPLRANVGGFLTAFPVSYFGHRHLTFGATLTPHGQALPRFALIAVSAFAINQGAYAVLLAETTLSYRVALAMVLVGVAAGTFVVSRFWAFAVDELVH